jgi:hypothetical protein
MAVYSYKYTRQQKVELMGHIIETFQKIQTQCVDV